MRVSKSLRVYSSLIIGFSLFVSTLEGLRAPRLTGQPRAEVFYRPGVREIKLHCQASGDSISYEWMVFRDGLWQAVKVRLGTGAENSGQWTWRRSSLEENNGDVYFGRPTNLQEGQYKCVASNSLGRAFSAIANVLEVTLNFAQLATRQYSVQEGDAVLLPCNHVYSAVPALAASPHSRTWYKNNATLQPDPRIAAADDGSLLLSYVRTQDAGHYHCRVRHIYPCSSSRRGCPHKTINGSFVRLNVTANTKERYVAPKLFHSTANPTTALNGTKVQLTCLFAGWPTPEVTWSRQGEQLEQTDNAIKVSSEGEYTCTGSNTQGDVSQTMEVRYQWPAVIVKGPVDANITEGASIIIQCRSNGLPRPDVTWYRNGEVLHPSDGSVTLESQFEVTDHGQNLEIFDLTVANSGIYACNTSNVHGYRLQSAYLNVTQRKAGAEDEPLDTKGSTTTTLPPALPTLRRSTLPPDNAATNATPDVRIASTVSPAPKETVAVVLTPQLYKTKSPNEASRNEKMADAPAAPGHGPVTDWNLEKTLLISIIPTLFIVILALGLVIRRQRRRHRQPSDGERGVTLRQNSAEETLPHVEPGCADIGIPKSPKSPKSPTKWRTSVDETQGLASYSTESCT